MIKKFLSILFFISATSLSLGQQTELYKYPGDIDSIKNDTLKVVHFFNLSRFYAETIPDSAYVFAENQLSIARKLDLKIEQVVALREMSYALMNMGNYPRSLQTLLSAIAL